MTRIGTTGFLSDDVKVVQFVEGDALAVEETAKGTAQVTIAAGLPPIGEGAEGDVLTLDAELVPAWSPPSGGSLTVRIATHTLTAAELATINADPVVLVTPTASQFVYPIHTILQYLPGDDPYTSPEGFTFISGEGPGTWQGYDTLLSLATDDLTPLMSADIIIWDTVGTVTADLVGQPLAITAPADAEDGDGEVLVTLFYYLYDAG